MDVNENTETPQTDSFAAEIAKTLIVSAVSTVGTVVGFVVIGAAVSKVQEIRKNRQDKKTTEETK